jgi:phosphopantothenoylcysteine decarboxylase/phosphopantothenate--cysteine ligase
LVIKNKRILITAGPTWVSLDSVRVISNIATGETGILLAEKLERLGAKVTLLLGPTQACCLSKKIKLIRFKFFDELKNIILKELKSKKYDMVIHSAAVSDYKPLKIYTHKVKSGIKKWQLNLAPAEKIIDLIKRVDQNLFLVGFKFEPNTNKAQLIKSTKVLIRRARLSLAIANTISQNQYKAYIVNEDKIYGPFLSRGYLTRELIKLLGGNLWRN